MDNIKKLVELRRKFRKETGKKIGDINGSTYTIEYTQWLQNELVKKLTIPVVVGQSKQLCDCVIPKPIDPYDALDSRTCRECKGGIA